MERERSIIQIIQNCRGERAWYIWGTERRLIGLQASKEGKQWSYIGVGWTTLWDPVDHGTINCNDKWLEGFERESDIWFMFLKIILKATYKLYWKGLSGNRGEPVRNFQRPVTLLKWWCWRRREEDWFEIHRKEVLTQSGDKFNAWRGYVKIEWRMISRFLQVHLGKW